MRFILIALGAVLALGGAIGLLFGLEISDIERGQTQAIVGSVLLVGGFLTIGLALILGRLEALLPHVSIASTTPNAQPVAESAEAREQTSEPDFNPPPIFPDAVSAAPDFTPAVAPDLAALHDHAETAATKDADELTSDLPFETSSADDNSEAEADPIRAGAARSNGLDAIPRPAERPRIDIKPASRFNPLSRFSTTARAGDTTSASTPASVVEPATPSLTMPPRRNIFLEPPAIPTPGNGLTPAAVATSADGIADTPRLDAEPAPEPRTDIFAFDLMFDDKPEPANAPEPPKVVAPSAPIGKPVPARSMTLPRGTWPKSPSAPATEEPIPALEPVPEPAHGAPTHVASDATSLQGHESDHAPHVPEEPAVPYAGLLANELRPESEVEVIGRHEANGATYVMYADGMIDAETSTGIWRFNSLDELKAHIEGQNAVDVQGSEQS